MSAAASLFRRVVFLGTSSGMPTKISNTSCIGVNLSTNRVRSNLFEPIFALQRLRALACIRHSSPSPSLFAFGDCFFL
jgi:hypothetical protein